MGFAQDVAKTTQKQLVEINSTCFQIAKELFESVVKLTPSPSNPGKYAAGLLANQWYPELGADFSDELGPKSDTSPDGSSSLARIQALQGTDFFQTDGSVTLANNSPYAYRAEVVGWPSPDWTGQVGPYRMVAKSIQKIKAEYP